MEKESLFSVSRVRQACQKGKEIEKCSYWHQEAKLGWRLMAFTTVWVDEAMEGRFGDWSLSHGPSPGTGQIHKCRALPEDALLTLLIHSSYTKVIQIFISWLEMALVFLIPTNCHSAFQS